MRQEVGIHPLASPWGRFRLYSFFIDAPKPAIVDTGIASSPADGMAPALRALGRRIEDVRWILLTHGHIDHVGGAHALWELTGRKAQVVIHQADAPLLASRRAHLEQYVAVRQQYLNDPHGVESRRQRRSGSSPEKWSRPCCSRAGKASAWAEASPCPCTICRAIRSDRLPMSWTVTTMFSSATPCRSTGPQMASPATRTRTPTAPA